SKSGMFHGEESCCEEGPGQEGRCKEAREEGREEALSFERTALLEMPPVRSFIRKRLVSGRPGRISRAHNASRVVVTTLALLLASSMAADAKVSVTNRDTKDHKITIIIEGQANQDQVLK